MTTRDPRRNQRDYRRAVARLRAKSKRLNAPCSLCGKPIDYNASDNDPNAFTADHVTPLAAGGHILGPLRPAHRRCNSRRGDGKREQRIPTSRRW